MIPTGGTKIPHTTWLKNLLKKKKTKKVIKYLKKRMQKKEKCIGIYLILLYVSKQCEAWHAAIHEVAKSRTRLSD